MDEMTMRERIARALWNDSHPDWEADAYDLECYFRQADAVLVAMREPPEAMLEAVEPELRRAAVDGEQPWSWHVGRIWQAMIGEALAEQPAKEPA